MNISTQFDEKNVRVLQIARPKLRRQEIRKQEIRSVVVRVFNSVFYFYFS